MIYVYKCDECQETQEIDETMAEHGVFAYACQKCGTTLESVITGGQGFVLQGGTWGRDGYKSHGVINGD